jgi:hypothetical protein
MKKGAYAELIGISPENIHVLLLFPAGDFNLPANKAGYHQSTSFLSRLT